MFFFLQAQTIFNYFLDFYFILFINHLFMAFSVDTSKNFIVQENLFPNCANDNKCFKLN